MMILPWRLFNNTDTLKERRKVIADTYDVI